MDSAVNDLILSARFLIRNGVPAGKRIIIAKGMYHNQMVANVYPEVVSVETLGQLAELDLLDKKKGSS
jgi:hypothetical protein